MNVVLFNIFWNEENITKFLFHQNDSSQNTNSSYLHLL